MGNFFTFDKNQAGSFEPLPIAEYEAIISKAEVTTSKSSGAPMIKVELTVRPDVAQAGAKRKIFDNIVFMDTAMFKVHQLAGAVGISNASSVEDYAQQLYAKPVRFKNKHEAYNGNTNDKVAFYKAAEAEGAAELIGAGADNPFGGGSTVNVGDEDFPF